jgi:UPF0716 protein FxsA
MFARFLVLIVSVPLVELLLLTEVGGLIGPLRTLAIIFLTGALGVWAVRSRGVRLTGVMRQLFEALREGRLPQDEVFDDFLVLVAAAALVTPGFLADIFGLFLLIPFGRAWARRRLSRYLVNHFRLSRAEPLRPAKPGGEVIIEAEVIRPDTGTGKKKA